MNMNLRYLIRKNRIETSITRKEAQDLVGDYRLKLAENTANQTYMDYIYLGDGKAVIVEQVL